MRVAVYVLILESKIDAKMVLIQITFCFVEERNKTEVHSFFPWFPSVYEIEYNL